MELPHPAGSAERNCLDGCFEVQTARAQRLRDDTPQRPPSALSPARPRVWRLLLLVLMGLAGAAALAEIAIRLTPWAEVEFYTYDPDRGWALRANAAGWQRREGVAYVRTNSQGLRADRDYAVPKPPGVYRIAVVGDSYTEARQVDAAQTFCAVMQRFLRRCPALHGKKVEVLNFGVDSYNTAQELMTLRKQVWRYTPDFVVLETFPGNDVKENSLTLESDQCRPFPVLHDGRFALGGPFVQSWHARFDCWMRFESRHSQILDILGQVRRPLLLAWRRRPLPKGAELGINPTVYKPPSDPAWEQAWQVSEAAISEFHHEVARRGVGFMVVVPTIGIQVDPKLNNRQSFMKAIGVNNLFYPDDRLLALGRREGFFVLDLSRPLQSYVDAHETALHGFPNTTLGYGHWNAQGHRLAGQLIAEQLSV